jgi:hypothetical protein
MMAAPARPSERHRLLPRPVDSRHTANPVSVDMSLVQFWPGIAFACLALALTLVVISVLAVLG